LTGEIRRVRERLAYEEASNPWLKVFFDDVVFPDGSSGRFNRVVEGGLGRGVAILPISASGVGLIRVYRYAAGGFFWEIPRGLSESDSDETEARRELLEETGIVARAMTPLGFAYPNSSTSTMKVSMFAATCSGESPSGSTDPHEPNTFRWTPFSSLAQVLLDEVHDCISLAAIAKARALGLLDTGPDAPR
jgi:8-oxo-dGTP pyrophosphatase MutT (NUDIX family)